MYFLDELTSTVRDQGLALGKMIVTTEPTARQVKTKEVLDKIYGVTKNLFFLCIVVTFVVFQLLQFAGDHSALLPLLESLWDTLSLPVIAAASLALIALVLLLLRGLLFLFKFINANELTNFILFSELINLAHQYLSEPTVRPTPFLFEMLRQIFGL